MAFFDELGKKITQTSQGAVQKTKNMAEIVKINGMISDEEKKINNLFNQIGKVYFETHLQDPDPNLAQFFTAIKEAKTRVLSYSEQVKQLKGIVNCPKCGGEVPHGSPFCNSCGSSMGVAPTLNVSPCTNCGAPVAEGKAFCTNCGTKVVGSPVAEPPIPPVVEPPVGPVAEEQVVDADAKTLCTNCGNFMAKGKSFCTNCGQKMISAQEIPVPVSTPVAPATKICGTCGKELSDKASFCSGCGNKIGG